MLSCVSKARPGLKTISNTSSNCRSLEVGFFGGQLVLLVESQDACTRYRAPVHIMLCYIHAILQACSLH